MTMGLSGTLRSYRKQKKMTQQEVAARIGLQRSTYSRYEEGTNRPSWKVLIKLADLYGITMDELVGRRTRSSHSVREVEPDKQSMMGVNREIEVRQASVPEGREGAEDEGTLDAELLQRMLSLFLSANSYAKETALLILENGQKKL